MEDRREQATGAGGGTSQAASVVPAVPVASGAGRPPGDVRDVQDMQHDELIVEDVLVEDVSIDGMCGVY